jgi:hypothetical protein
MKKTIWKFEIGTNKIIIEMPKGAEILTIQTQYNVPCIWAMVDPNAEKELRHFEIFETGHEIYFDMGVERKYINSFQLLGGDLVFHVFERIN